MEYTRQYLDEVAAIAQQFPVRAVEELVRLVAGVRDQGGRMFVLGIGGGAANASHAAADLRTLAEVEAYAATDNVAALTALTNDRGWSASLAAWLVDSRLCDRDGLLVFSVGGGSLRPPVSENLVEALRLAKERGAVTAGVVGRDGGLTAELADVCVIVPTVAAERVTPHTESFQAAVWHLAVTHPVLRRKTATWENLAASR